VGGWVTVLFLIIWIAASGVLLYLYSQQNSQNEDIFCKKRQNLFRHGEGMQQRIEQQRKIADS